MSIHSPARRAVRAARAFTVCAVTAVVAVLANPLTSTAGGQAYSPTTWAGTRVSAYHWAIDNRWYTPDKVEAKWKVPCVPPTADGVYGDFDMWIGMEGWNGRLIQVGVRVSHQNYWWPELGVPIGLVNRYWAWVVDTANPGMRSPVHVFEIDDCGPNVENTTVSAWVRTNGEVHIEAASLRTGGSRGYSALTGAPMATPRYAEFVLERTYSAGNLPNFGVARFTDCKVTIRNGAGNYLGNGDVAAEQFTMSSLQPPLPWPHFNWPAVLTGSPDNRGNFSLSRFRSR